MKEFASKFSVAKVFSDKMVLQRDEKIKIWGFAEHSDDGKYIKVSFSDKTCEAIVKDGKWTAEFEDTFAASKQSRVLTVSGDGCEYSFRDVLVGDVYLVIGQSNIRYNVDAIINGAPEGYPGRDFKISDNEQIRFNRSSIHDADDNEIYPVRGTEEVVEDIRTGRSWGYPSEEGAEFSAIGYFTAHMIYNKTNGDIPIGLIEIDADGQSLCTFFPNDYADNKDLDFIEDGLHRGILLGGEHTPSRYVFNHFIAPFVGYAICGLIWYQGESDFNNDNAPVFAERYTGLINNFRNKWNLINHNFPVVMVELPSVYPLPSDKPADTMWAYIDMGRVRAEMGRIPNMLENCYLSASSDLWLDAEYWNSLHPYCKWPQAERISAILLAVRYGIGELDKVAGPQYEKISYNNTSASVTYRYTDNGLTSVDSSDIKGFEVLCNNEWIKPNDITITDDKTLTLNAASEIKGVRYNAVTDNFFPDKVNLSSAEGIPAIAFCDLK